MWYDGLEEVSGMKVLLIVVGIIVALLGTILLVVGLVAGATELWIASLLVLFISAMMFLQARRKSPPQKKAIKQTDFPMTEEQLAAIENDQLPIVLNTPVMLRLEEVVHYITPAWLSETKHQVIGSTGGGGGVSFRVAKGIYLHSGKSGSRRVYGDVTNTFKGDLAISNQRVVFIQRDKGFEIKIPQITAIRAIQGGISLQSKSKTFDLLVPCPEYPMVVIQKCFNELTSK